METMPLSAEELTMLWNVWASALERQRGDLDVKDEGACYSIRIGDKRIAEVRKQEGVFATAIMLSLGYVPRLAQEVEALREQFAILMDPLVELYPEELGKAVDVQDEDGNDWQVPETLAQTAARLLRAPKERRIVVG